MCVGGGDNLPSFDKGTAQLAGPAKLLREILAAIIADRPSIGFRK